MVGAVQDITDIRRTEAQLNYVTRFDPVTGLINQATLLERTGKAMMEADILQQSVALLVFQLERYKTVSQSLGTEAGEAFLRQAAERVLERLGEELDLARVGDDEFAALLTRLPRGEEAARTAQEIAAAFEDPFHIEGQEVYSAAVAGIALYPTDAPEASALLKNANAAMRSGREQGKGPYCFYTADMNARAMQQISLEGALRRALEQEQFVLFYQPQLAGDSQRTVGFEALLRWQHPEYGTVSPGTFIPVLEETGLIQSVGNWLLREAGAQCHRWNESRSEPVRMAINLSAEQFGDADLIPAIQRAVANQAIHPQDLELEITESVAMRDPKASLATLNALKEMGFTVAIDDFGTGYSSLSYLKQLPLDKLKIDGSFVFDMHTSADDAAIVRSTIHLAHDLGLKVVAEGVEEAEHIDMLADMGCDVLQGFYFGRPVPAAEAAAFLENPQ